MLNENGIKVHAIINDIKKSERISNKGKKRRRIIYFKSKRN